MVSPKVLVVLAIVFSAGLLFTGLLSTVSLLVLIGICQRSQQFKSANAVFRVAPAREYILGCMVITEIIGAIIYICRRRNEMHQHCAGFLSKARSLKCLVVALMYGLSSIFLSLFVFYILPGGGMLEQTILPVSVCILPLLNLCTSLGDKYKGCNWKRALLITLTVVSVCAYICLISTNSYKAVTDRVLLILSSFIIPLPYVLAKQSPIAEGDNSNSQQAGSLSRYRHELWRTTKDLQPLLHVLRVFCLILTTTLIVPQLHRTAEILSEEIERENVPSRYKDELIDVILQHHYINLSTTTIAMTQQSFTTPATNDWRQLLHYHNHQRFTDDAGNQKPVTIEEILALIDKVSSQLDLHINLFEKYIQHLDKFILVDCDSPEVKQKYKAFRSHVYILRENFGVSTTTSGTDHTNTNGDQLTEVRKWSAGLLSGSLVIHLIILSAHLLKLHRLTILLPLWLVTPVTILVAFAPCYRGRISILAEVEPWLSCPLTPTTEFYIVVSVATILVISHGVLLLSTRSLSIPMLDLEALSILPTSASALKVQISEQERPLKQKTSRRRNAQVFSVSNRVVNN